MIGDDNRNFNKNFFINENNVNINRNNSGKIFSKQLILDLKLFIYFKIFVIYIL